MRATTPDAKRDICERLLRAWLRHPHLRLGQLLACVFPHEAKPGQDIFLLEDAPLIEKIEQWQPKEVHP